MLRQNVRRTLHGLVPWLVDPDPMSEVSRGMPLSEAYRRMSQLGVIQRVRRNNDDIMRDHFEKETGMVRSGDARWRAAKTIGVYALPVAAAALFTSASVLGSRGE